MMRRKIVIIQKSHKYHVSASKTKNYEKKSAYAQGRRISRLPGFWLFSALRFSFWAFGLRLSAFGFGLSVFHFSLFTLFRYFVFQLSASSFRRARCYFFIFCFFVFSCGFSLWVFLFLLFTVILSFRCRLPAGAMSIVLFLFVLSFPCLFVFCVHFVAFMLGILVKFQCFLFL